MQKIHSNCIEELSRLVLRGVALPYKVSVSPAKKETVVCGEVVAHDPPVVEYYSRREEIGTMK